jgi:hypothetical protein
MDIPTQRGKIGRLISSINSNPEKWILLFLSAVSIISVTSIVILSWLNRLAKGDFGQEVGKTALQIISVSVIGTIASLLIALFNNKKAELQKEVEKEQLKRDREIELERLSDENNIQFKKDILRQLNELNSTVKRARRMLRAKAFSRPYYKHWGNKPDVNVYLVVYEKYMEEINDAQLRLEIITKEIKTNSSAFKRSQEILAYFESVETQLKKVVTEYEEKRSFFTPDTLILSINELPELDDMVGEFRSSEFKKIILDSKNLVASIRKDILDYKKAPITV